MPSKQKESESSSVHTRMSVQEQWKKDFNKQAHHLNENLSSWKLGYVPVGISSSSSSSCFFFFCLFLCWIYRWKWDIRELICKWSTSLFTSSLRERSVTFCMSSPTHASAGGDVVRVMTMSAFPGLLSLQQRFGRHLRQILCLLNLPQARLGS